MNRRDLLAALTTPVAIGLAAAKESRAQDFGRFLEKAARDTIQRQVEPGNVRRMLAPEPAGPEAFPIKTPDGWTLVAHRYRPTGQPVPGALPIVLCHGLTYNAKFWDLDPSCSFARYLASAGYDVWAVDLRGCGQSQKWVFRLDEAPDALIGGALRRATGGKLNPTGYQTIDPKYAKWTMDDHIAFDVPSFVRLVRHHTGAPGVNWIGHSMGGIVAIALLSRYQNPGIARLATIGSQVTMANGQLVLPLLEQLLLQRQQQLAGQLGGQQLAAMTRTSVHNLFFNTDNVSPVVYEALGTWATDVPSVGLMKQYITLSQRGVLLDAAGRCNYAEALANVQVPMLIACGASDQFAPPPVQQYLMEHVGTADKRLAVFGRAQGFAADCGHDDALVGLGSQQEVFPVIEGWLRGAPA